MNKMSPQTRFYFIRIILTLALTAALVFCAVCITACKARLISINAKYTGGSVEVGGSPDTADIVVTATYGDNSSKIVTAYSLEYDFSVAGLREVTVRYTEDNQTKLAVFNVEVVQKSVLPDPPVLKVTLDRISAVYNGQNVKVGASLNNADISVTAHYSDDSSKNVTNFTVGNFSSAVTGTQQVEISYTDNNVTKTCYISVNVVENSQQVVANSNLSIHFLELGNNQTGDSVYIKAGETDILIDAGSNKSSTPTLINYLDKFVTDKKLEYVIATHAHEDHIAGFVGPAGKNGIFDEYECETIIDFNLTNYEMTDKNGKDTLYAEYIKKRDAEVELGAKRYSALECYQQSVEGAKRTFNLTSDGNITMEILYQKYYDNVYKSSENNYSVCLMINQKIDNGKTNHYLFTGDLENGGEKSLVEENNLPQVTLFKAGHHGSNTSTTARLLQVIQPQYIMVCCCAGNVQYTQNLANTFPYQETINRIAPYTDNVYVTTMGIIALDDPEAEWDSKTNRWRNKGFTSMNGNIVFNCVNGEITLDCSNNNTKLKDTEWFEKFRDCPPEWQTVPNQ